MWAGLSAAAVVVGTMWLWGDARMSVVRRHFAGVASALSKWWAALLALSLAMAFGFALFPIEYDLAQRADTVRDFKDVVGSDATAFRLVAAYDMAFAAVYGAAAVALVPVFRRLGGDAFGHMARRLGSVGATILMAAALVDLVENTSLLVALGDLDNPSPSAVERTALIGSVKWSLAAVGVVTTVGASLVRFFTASATREWVRLSAPAYTAYLGGVGLLVTAATLHQRWLFWILVPGLLLCGSWLNRIVGKSRESPEAAASKGWVRARIAIVQAGVAVVLFSAGLNWPSVVGDTAVVLAVALMILSLGAFVSEFRQITWRRVGVARALFGLAAALFALAWLFDNNITWICLAVAVVAGELATELSAETYRRGPTRESSSDPRIRVAAAATGVVGSVIGMVLIGVEVRHALLVVAVLSIVVWMATTDGDSLVVVGLLAVALVASTRPSDLDVADTLKPLEGVPYILVLGDSYTSGEGATHYIPGTNEVVRDHAPGDPRINECRQAPSAWPFQVAERFAALNEAESGDLDALPSRVLFLACSGAVTENVLPEDDPRSYRNGTTQLSLYEERVGELGKPSLVIIGIGGNDAGFGDLVASCVGPGNCAELATQFLTGRIDRPRPDEIVPPDDADAPPRNEALVDIGDDLRGAYEAIRTVLDDPSIPIVAAGYPSPIATGGRCDAALLTESERDFIDGFVTQLNAVVHAAAQDAQISYMDLTHALARQGAQICASGPGGAGLNFIAFGSKGGSIRDSLNPKAWSHNSMHPNQVGHAAIAGAAAEWLEDELPLTQPVRDPVGGDDDVPPLTPDVLIAQLVDDGAVQCTEGSACTVDGGKFLQAEAHDLHDSFWPAATAAVLVVSLRYLFLVIVAFGHGRQLSLYRIARDWWLGI